MKKLVLVFLCATFILGFAFTNAGAFTVLKAGDNEMYFSNHEGLYRSDDNGVYRELDYSGADPGLQKGDIFVGIISLQNVDQLGTTHWFQSGVEQVSGIFAQEVVDFYTPNNDPYDPLNGQTHIILGAASVSNFTTLTDEVFTTNLSGDEILALYTQEGAGTTTYESNGTIVDDVTKATDGNKWMTFGYSAGADGKYETGDDDGYSYSHTTIGLGLGNFTGETFSALNIIYNSTGLITTGVNDPNENESSQWLGQDILTSIYFDADLSPNNPNYDNGTSPWAFFSQDPANINVVPEPGTFFLFGFALLGLSSMVRRKKY